ncbi:MAG TPA: T9SS type A sorting domain-containing protein, partial [Chitinophagaceae bacterium]|nr:T9SS type A sorting domain-containing protein [Chitinophagaceae bacterium]
SSPYGGNCMANFSKTIYVKDSNLHVFADTICSNDLPYVWQGDTLLNSGVYSKQFTNMLGCDSTLVLYLQVNIADSIYVNDTICSNQLPYYWLGNTIAGSGVYTTTFTNMNGCDSVLRLNLQVYSIDSTSFADTICSNQLPYVWQGQSINSSGTYSVTFQNKYGCDSILNLFLTIEPATSEILSDTICSNQLPYYWLGDTIAVSGVYTHVLSKTNGCDSTLLLNLQVNLVDSIYVNDTICSNQLPYIWQGNTIVSSGAYTTTFTNMNGCDSVLRLNLQVYSIDSMGFADTICSNQLPYAWQGQVIASSGSYTAKYQNAVGCDSVLNLNLTVHPSYNSIQYDTICSNDLPYQWQQHLISSAGFYSDTLASMLQCDSIMSLNLIVYDNYNGQLRQEGNRLFCPWNNLINYKWYFNGRLMKNTDTSLLISEPGNYELQAMSREGCPIQFVTNVLEESFTSLHIYPNPTNTIFNIEFDLYLSSTVHFTLLDLAGNVIKVVSSASKLNPGRHHVEFSISDLNLSNGIYFLQRNDDSGSWVEKVSILK